MSEHEAGPALDITRNEWRAARHPHCMVCGEYPIARLEVHEIARGAAKAKAMTEPSTWILTCAKCHEDRLAAMPIVTQLAIKRLEDKEHYDPARVNVLRGRAPGHITDAEVLVEVEELRNGREPWMNPYRWVG